MPGLPHPGEKRIYGLRIQYTDVYTPIVQGIRAIINQLPAQEQRIINGRKRGKGAEQVCVMNMPSS
jgi:hypothetical protein